MQYLFLSFGALAIAAFASWQFTVSLAVSLIVITLVVKFTASTVIGSVTLGDSFKSAAMAFTFLGLAIIGLVWAFQGKAVFEGTAALLVLAGLFAAFVFGFKSVFGSTFGASSTIAVVSTVVSGALFYLLKPYLF
jgi:hypothetical protein